MNLLETLIINAILVTFPILVYEYFIVYTQNMKKEKVKILLSFVLFISLYLSMYYKQFIPNNYQFTSIILPVLIAYFNKKPKEAIVMSLIITEYLIKDLRFNIYITTTFFILLYLCYIKYSKTNKTRNYLINISIILISITLLLNEYLLKGKIVNNVIDIILAIIIYTIVIKIINKGIEEADNIIKMHTALKSFEKEKSIRLSLFKITHEIKNPIAVVKGYLDMFDPNNKEKSTRYISVIKNEIERTLNLLTDFMEFSKIKIEKELIDINLLIDEVKDIVIPFFNSKNVSYNFEIEDEIYANLDFIRMKQVIINIIKNAVEACDKEKSHVSTTVFKDSESLYIYVKDNGGGISKEVMDNMLSPFYTTKEKGTGLGVSLSKEIIESHKGEISYNSTLTKGTVCKITLPLF